MRFLIDENLPVSVGEIFAARGFHVDHVRNIDELRGKSDEVIFDYATHRDMIIVSRDLGFANILRFDLRNLEGVILLRFPNEISIAPLCEEVKRLTKDLTEQDFQNLIVIEPGSLRKREL